MNYYNKYLIIFLVLFTIFTFIYLYKNKLIEIFQYPKMDQKHKYILTKNTILNLLNQN